MAEFNKIYDAFDRYGEITTLRIAKVLQNTSKLKNLISHEVEVLDDGDMVLKMNIPKYGIFVDEGRRAGAKMPPIKPIMEWAKSKGLPRFRSKSGRFLKNETRAFLIARAIGRDGIKPRPFIYLFFDHIDQLLKMLGPAAAADIAEAMQVSFNDAGIGTT